MSQKHPEATARAQPCPPHLADWYARAVIGRNIPGGTETSEVDGYFTGRRPRRTDFGPLYGGWRILKFTSTRIRR